MMKKLLKWFSVPALLVLVYLVGPTPAKPTFESELPIINQQGEALEQLIVLEEEAVAGIKEDNQARIIWADSSKKEKTPYSIVYLHGFGASQAEGEPVHRNLARKFGCNLYLSRFAEHGVEGDSIFKDLKAQDLVASTRKAVAIGKQIGDEVIIVGTSTGGALGLYIASQHPDIKALICYSPIIDFYDKNTLIIDKPWGIQLMRMIVGSDFFDNEKPPLVRKYWTSRYMINGVVALNSFVKEAMIESTFKKVTCPVFLGYYYKNDSLQDQIVSVPAMLEMFEQLGTVDQQKLKVAFPESGDHVIASYITSKDYQGVEIATENFLREVVGLDTTVVTDSSTIYRQTRLKLSPGM